MGQSLFGDELFTHADLAGRGVAGVVGHVANGGVEDNPPLFYVLAELSSHLGAPEVWLRLPSVRPEHADGAAPVARRAGSSPGRAPASAPRRCGC